MEVKIEVASSAKYGEFTEVVAQAGGDEKTASIGGETPIPLPVSERPEIRTVPAIPPAPKADFKVETIPMHRVETK